LQKVGFIALVFLLTSSCSVFKGLNEVKTGDVEKDKGKSVSVLAKERNLFHNSFYIKSMEVDIKMGKDDEKLLASLRFEKPDKYLISLRSRSGIEISRIFIDRDSGYIVDRIKRKVYKGSVKNIEKKYGVPLNILPVLLGDFCGSCGLEYESVNKDKLVLCKCSIDKISLRYEIDHGIGKVKAVSLENGFGAPFFSADFDKFKRESEAVFPTRINWIDLERNVNIEINIQKIEYPWNDKIEFSFGNRYEVIELL
jgi:hypothetical protein